jgi:site-specific recombinase XerD
VPRLKAGYELSLEAMAESRRSVVDLYLAARRRSKSASTWVRDRSIVTRWALWCQEKGVELCDAKESDAEDFLLSWPWAATTKKQAITDLRTFYRWLVRREACQRNPFEYVEGPRKPRRLPVVLTEEEISALRGAFGRPTVRDLRDRAFLLCLQDTGARVGEVRSMDLDRLNLRERYAIVHGKGDKDRIVYFTDETVRAIQRWLLVRDRWAKSHAGPLFVGRRGSRIGYTAARELVIRAEQRAQLARHVRPHLFRHTWATRTLEAGANLREVQELLGHASIATTQIYTHIAPSRLREVYDRTRLPVGAADK